MSQNEKKASCLFPYNIFIIGFMGSGKTTISNYLHKEFAMDALEMDAIISEREGMSIPDIFAKKGEEYFRALETQLLIEIQGKHNVVVSCGGGVPMRENNVIQMKKSGRVVLLTASAETIYARTKDSHDRPLLENNKNVPYIAKLMGQRKERYEAAADIIIETDQKEVSVICKEIMDKLAQLDQK